MNTTAVGAVPSDSDWLRYETLLERFESELRGGGEPNINDHLPAADDAGRRHVLVELIKLEFEYRWRRGDRPSVADYVRRFPELGDPDNPPPELVAAESRVCRAAERSALTTKHCAEPAGTASEIRRSGAGSSGGDSTSGDAPRKLGRYELRERVGHGGFAVVYRAWDPELNREVAIKTPRHEFLDANELIQRVHREARAAAQLRHPAIVPIYEVGEDAGRTFIVYQFIHGPTLARLLQETKPAPRQAAAWVMQIAEALEYAHTAGIVHRDIKPANILMDRGEQPMIADFGLARGDDAGATLTQEGDILGTPAYMSPEQAQGRGHSADARSDVYGLGVLLYELITGRAPFVGPTASILQQVINDEPPRPSSIKRQSDVDLETITLKAMAKEPDRRYASAGLMAEDLRAYLEHRPIRARRIGPLARMIRWCRRRPTVAATIAAAALVCLVTAAVSIHRVIAERDAARVVSANLALDRAAQLATDGESGQALLWLVRSLELSPRGVENLRGAIRTNLAAYEHLVARPERLLEHRGPVQAVAWSVDGRFILTGSDDKTARLWEPATGRPLGEPLPHEHEVMSVALSLDRTIAVTGDDYGTVRSWDLTESRETGSFRADAAIYAVAISPDGQTIMAGASNGTAYLWNRATGKPIGEPLTHKTTVTGFAHPVAVAFRADGRVAVTASRDGVIRRWDAATGNPLGATNAVEHGVRSVSLFRGGESALICRDDNTGVLLDLTRDPIAELPLPFSGILQGGAISRDGRLLVTGGTDRTARLWDAQTLSPHGAPLRHPDRVYSVAFSPDAQMVVTACHDGFARIWRISSIESGAAALKLQHDAPVFTMAFSGDGSRLFTGCGWRLESGSAQLWNAHTGEPIGSPLPIGVQQLGVAISPDGRTLATGHYDGQTQLWDAATGEPIGEPIAPIRDRISNVTLTAFSPHGKTLMTGSFTDNSPLFWDVATRQPIDRKLDHGHVVRSAVWSRDGKLILTGGGDGAAKLWDFATGRQLIPAMQHQGQVGTVALSNDNRFILVGTDADRAQLWDATTGAAIGPPLEHKGTVRGVAFSPDGQLMATASWDRTARIWDRATGKPIGSPLLHEREVEAVTFSPDGQRVVTGSWDKTVRFWPVPAPRDGAPDQLRLWAEVLTNMELDRHGAIRLLPADSWRDRREKLAAAPTK